MNLGEIEALTKEFATARGKLKDRVESLEDEIAALKRKYLPGIKLAASAAMVRQANLKAAIEEAPTLFVKPKTLLLHGIKVGYRKQKGEVTWENKDKLIQLIRKHLPDQADLLIQTTEKPVKGALVELSGAELKRIGVTVTNDTDVVVIKSTDSDIDKLVGALLADDEDLEEAA